MEYYGLGNVVRYQHLEDTYNNTFRALRLLRRDAGTGRRVPAGSAPWTNLLYAEFTSQPDWHYENPVHYELFNVRATGHGHVLPCRLFLG